MSGSVRKRRILIIAAWIVCLIAANSLFFHIEKQVYYERAETDLLGETEIIANRSPSLLRTALTLGSAQSGCFFPN